MNFLAVSVQVLHAKLSLPLDLLKRARGAFTGNTRKPARGRIVIVSAGVDNHIAMIVVRQVVILRITAECKLQNAHAGKTTIVSQSFNIRSDHAQVFSDDWQLTQRLTDGNEQL